MTERLLFELKNCTCLICYSYQLSLSKNFRIYSFKESTAVVCLKRLCICIAIFPRIVNQRSSWREHTERKVCLGSHLSETTSVFTMCSLSPKLQSCKSAICFTKDDSLALTHIKDSVYDRKAITVMDSIS